MLYAHTDHLGAPRKMTIEDGAVLWDAAFTPFGVEDSITGTAANDNRFPGQYYETAVALNYNWWRQYDPTIGRYIQSDPIGLEGGLNTYLYAKGNPLRFTDPTGLFSPEEACRLFSRNPELCILKLPSERACEAVPGSVLPRIVSGNG